MSERTQSSHRWIGYFFFSVFALCIDQASKLAAYYTLRPNGAVSLVPDIFELQYLENKSAAFGVDPISLLHRLFHFQVFVDHPAYYENTRTVFFVLLTVAVLAILFLFLKRIPTDKRFRPLTIDLVLFMTGAVGNFIDRLFRRYVVDFFYFKLIDFPIFNIADIYVTAAAIGLIILCLFYYKEEDFERIFSKKTMNKADQR